MGKPGIVNCWIIRFGCLMGNKTRLVHHPIFTEVIVSEPATGWSLNRLTESLSSRNAIEYSKGK